MPLPSGKAIFVRRWAMLGTSTPAAFVRRYKGGGFRWSAPVVQVGNGEGARSPNRNRAYFQALQRAGIQTWGCWVLPNPANAGMLDTGARLVDWLASVGATGLLNDPEVEFQGRRRDAERLQSSLVERCRAAGLGYGVTSYGLTQGHPNFPWAEFADGADFGLAQTYDGRMLFEADYPARGVEQYLAAGFRVAFPAAGMWNKNEDKPKTPAQLARHFAFTRNAQAAACWPLPTVNAQQWAKLAAWKVGASSSNGAGALMVGAGLLGLGLLLAKGGAL